MSDNTEARLAELAEQVGNLHASLRYTAGLKAKLPAFEAAAAKDCELRRLEGYDAEEFARSEVEAMREVLLQAGNIVDRLTQVGSEYTRESARQIGRCRKRIEAALHLAERSYQLRRHVEAIAICANAAHEVYGMLGERLESLAEELGMPASAGSANSPVAEAKPTANSRMLEKIMKDPESRGWNSTQWSEFLKRSTSAVCQTDTWKILEKVRLDEKARNMTSRRRH